MLPLPDPSGAYQLGHITIDGMGDLREQSGAWGVRWGQLSGVFCPWSWLHVGLRPILELSEWSMVEHSEGVRAYVAEGHQHKRRVGFSCRVGGNVRGRDCIILGIDTFMNGTALQEGGTILGLLWVILS